MRCEEGKIKRTVKEIKEILESTPPHLLPMLISELELDIRKSVQKLVLTHKRRYENHITEINRLESLWEYEKEFEKRGLKLIAGVDEAGRGPLAGPVAAGAVILPKDTVIIGLNDSKKLSAAQREELYKEIKEKAIASSVAMVSAKRIDSINILQATYEAMREAILALSPVPEGILADAVTIPNISFPQRGIIKGDQKSASIAAASILAKVERDRFMAQADISYPGYGFKKHKGYGTSEHIAAINELGLCPIHRRTFVKNLLEDTNTVEKGIIGESVAAKHLERQGFNILKRNYIYAHGEIDIIAQKENLLVFCEVKLRHSAAYGTPAEAVGKKKRTLILQTAAAYMAESGIADMDVRFDVIEVTPIKGEYEVNHIKSAFEH